MTSSPVIKSSEGLLTAAQKLDPDALAAIHDQHYPRLFRYISFRVSDPALIEDFASETFLRLVEALKQKQGPRQNVQGWLYATASHLIADHYRRKYARKESSLEEHQITALEYPEEQADVLILRQHLQQALSQLKPHEQEVLSLRFSEERSLEEVAQMMQKTVGAVKVLQFRAVAALRKILEGGNER